MFAQSTSHKSTDDNLSKIRICPWKGLAFIEMRILPITLLISQDRARAELIWCRILPSVVRRTNLCERKDRRMALETWGPRHHHHHLHHSGFWLSATFTLGRPVLAPTAEHHACLPDSLTRQPAAKDESNRCRASSLWSTTSSHGFHTEHKAVTIHELLATPKPPQLACRGSQTTNLTCPRQGLWSPNKPPEAKWRPLPRLFPTGLPLSTNQQ